MGAVISLSQVEGAMKPEILRVVSALIVAVGLIVGGYLAGGRYTIVQMNGQSIARLDRWTGAVKLCLVGMAYESTKGEDSCAWEYEPPPAGNHVANSN
jgi:hypothetical protein